MKKTNEPLVSVIIPTYNRAHLIAETLDSVSAQTYQNWECIIVDDGSSDNTDEVVGEYVNKDNRFKYYHRPEEHLPGGNGARNYGFKMSQGEYVNWFDSDDLMVAEKFKNQIDIFNRSSKIDVVFSNFQFFKSDKSESKKLTTITISKENFIKKYVLKKTLAPINSALWQKKTILNFQFNEQLIQYQEYEYFGRIFSSEPNISFCDKSYVLVRVNHESITTTKINLSQVQRSVSHIAAKLNLIKSFDHRHDIQIGLLNHLLKGLNSSLNNPKFNKKITHLYIVGIDSMIRTKRFKKYLIKWILLKILSKLILKINKGAFKFRGLYQFR